MRAYSLLNLFFVWLLFNASDKAAPPITVALIFTSKAPFRAKGGRQDPPLSLPLHLQTAPPTARLSGGTNKFKFTVTGPHQPFLGKIIDSYLIIL